MRLKNSILSVLVCVFTFGLSVPSVVFADDIPKNEIFRSSGLPLPRFVSLSNHETNVRAGPGQHYPIKWVMKRKGLPVEVVLEYDNWRKIKDPEGEEGWVFHTLLSGKRTALIHSENPVYAYRDPYENESKKSIVTIELEPFVLVDIHTCKASWCNVSTSGLSGWVKRKSLWGVYEHERID